MKSVIQVEIVAHPSLEMLANLWRMVEQNTQHSVFTSWHWISAWLETDTCSEKYLLMATIDAKPVGLAIWTHHKRLGQHHYWLHKSGDDAIDQIWIEYNDFMVQDALQDSIKARMWQAWFAFTPKNSKYFIGASQPESFVEPQKHATFNYLAWAAKSYRMALASPCDLSLPVNDQRLLGLMSSNTRAQLRRSMQYFQTEYGALTLHFAPAEEAIALFDSASIWHKERWGQDGNRGFNNRSFIDFHHLLISRGYPEKMIDVVELRAGSQRLGVFYNFVWQQNAYFYLSSLHYQESNHARPGLVGHFLLAMHYLEAGLLSYDLLGGGEYKARFSTPGPELQVRVLYTAGWVNTLEILLRKLKATYKSWRIFRPNRRASLQRN